MTCMSVEKRRLAVSLATPPKSATTNSVAEPPFRPPWRTRMLAGLKSTGLRLILTCQNSSRSTSSRMIRSVSPRRPSRPCPRSAATWSARVRGRYSIANQSQSAPACSTRPWPRISGTWRRKSGSPARWARSSVSARTPGLPTFTAASPPARPSVRPPVRTSARPSARRTCQTVPSLPEPTRPTGR